MFGQFLYVIFMLSLLLMILLLKFRLQKIKHKIQAWCTFLLQSCSWLMELDMDQQIGALSSVMRLLFQLAPVKKVLSHWVASCYLTPKMMNWKYIRYIFFKISNHSFVIIACADSVTSHTEGCVYKSQYGCNMLACVYATSLTQIHSHKEVSAEIKPYNLKVVSSIIRFLLFCTKKLLKSFFVVVVPLSLVTVMFLSVVI